MKLKAAGVRSNACVITLFGVMLACLLACPVSGASAAGPYSFDAELSLTGDCSTSKVDLVPDPGCPEGSHPPSGAFASPRSVATDAYGDIFVDSWGEDAAEGAEGRIDIFNPEGLFLTELPDPAGPRNLALDGEGNLYVFEHRPGVGGRLVRYSPKVYKPLAGEIEYDETPFVIEKVSWFMAGMAVNPKNGHLFVHRLTWIAEYGSAEEENVLLDKIGEGVVSGNAQGLTVDAAHDRLYASDENVPGQNAIDVFELGGEHKAFEPIDGSNTPPEAFSNFITFAADESTGELSVYDGEQTNVVYQLTEHGGYIETIAHSFQYVAGAEIGVDNGPLSPNNGYLFVPSHPTKTGHSFAFGPPPEVFPPKVESIGVAEVSESDAELQAEIETGNLETTYTFEYEEEGAGGATVAGEGSIPAGEAPVQVAVQVEGLEPGTIYRFRVVATNQEGSDEAEDTFATFQEEPLAGGCANAALRVGPSALLPDCRAYELVTPPDTNGRTPLGVGYLGTYFATRQASPQGNAVTFEIEGGAIPGFEGTGSYAGDPYVTKRTGSGWSTEYTGPGGEESPALLPGSNSPDQGYSFWSTANGEGTAAVEEGGTGYIRYPDGHSALIGRGSLAQDPHALGKLISEGGTHIIFTSSNVAGEEAIQLEENAPADGTHAIYDRTADEVTHVVSLLPHDEMPAVGEQAFYQGASLDGEGVAFRFGPNAETAPTSALYLRYNNEETYEVAPAGVTFAGVAEGGKRVFYLEGGNLYAYEVGGTENPIAFSTTGDVTPVNVSADGSTAYFVSPSVLGEENPNEEVAQPGQENLYRSQEGAISFVGTVTERDVKGENGGNGFLDGLGLWTEAAATGKFGKDPSRTTPDGSTLLFESRAALNGPKGYDSEDHAEIYRYDSAGNELDCISCSPTLAKATGKASLQSVAREQGAPEPFGPFAYVTNLRADGHRAFFQSTEALVVGDTDKLQDIYEWEAQDVGSCEKEGGCIYLISSGHSKRVDYIWAVSDSGDDVFFRSSDLLVGSDFDSTPSIYDARAGGGFPEPPPPLKCQEANCQPAPTPPPQLPASLTPVLGGGQDAPPPLRCPKGKRKMVRQGKEVCVRKKKRHHKHHRRAGPKRKGASR